MTDEQAVTGTTAQPGMSRRGFFLFSALGFVAGAATVFGLDRIPALNRRKQDQIASGRPWYELGQFSDSIMNERVLFKLGQAWYRMADAGEVLDTVSRIQDGVPTSWRTEWFKTADRVRGMGDQSRSRGHTISAGEAYLRASSYYLAGLIYNESPTDRDLVRASVASAETFASALELLGMPGEPVQIPYEDTALPGYWFRSELGAGDAPVLIVHQGMDASVEEALFLATESTRRGYHALLFHHPGQGRALRELGLTFRPDWEKVITPVVDFALEQPGVDPTRIMLTGLSFGGSLVARAVAFEKRVRICIPNPAHYSWWDFLSSEIFATIPKAQELAANTPKLFDAAVNVYLQTAPPAHRWWFKSAMWKFGAASPSELLAILPAYTNADIVDQITCKVLVMASEAEAYGADYGVQFYDALKTEKERILFTAEDTALLHNQTGAISVSVQRMYDWIDENV
jgi:esterase/lipase